MTTTRTLQGQSPAALPSVTKRRPVLCAAAVFLAAIFAGAVEPAALRFVQSIPLPGVTGRFDHFAVDVKGQRLFVAALGNNTLEVIDLASGQRRQSLRGMAKPTGVLFLSEINQILVANGDDGTVRILNGSDYREVRRLSGLEDADNLRYDAARKLAWVGYAAGALGLIEPQSARILSRVLLPAHPEAFQLEAAGRIFVNVPGARRVVVIDADQKAVVQSWPLESLQANFPMALDPSRHRVLVGCRKPARLVVLDAKTGAHVAEVPIAEDTDDLFYDARRKRVYLSCGEGFLDVVAQDAADSYRRILRLATAPGARTSFFSPELDRLYLAVPARGSQPAEVRVYQSE